MRILVCVDSTPESHRALQRAVELCDTDSDELLLVSAAEPRLADPIVDESVRKARENAEFSFHESILDKVSL